MNNGQCMIALKAETVTASLLLVKDDLSPTQPNVRSMVGERINGTMSANE